MHVHIHIYAYTYTYIYICIYMYVYVYRRGVSGWVATPESSLVVRAFLKTGLK
jgi:hypothetical protein